MPADELASERAHLSSARRHLARMRARSEELDSAAAGDWVSQLFLESSLVQRRAALADDPTVPLFFGRLDYETTHPESGRPFYIGRRHVSDEGGDPMVVDWRAPISRPFYRASAREPLGVARRRRFGFQHGALTAYEDEALAQGEEESHSALLEEEIERPRTGPMRDIVATIQPEQDVIVRADLKESVCVQGAPGTGKTAVGLHRAAYLLYAFRQQLSRQGVLVVGPNDSFLRYIGDVLPALGEIQAAQTTVGQIAASALAAAGPGLVLGGEDPDGIAALKGDARWAEVLHRAVWGHLRAPEEGLLVPRGSRRWRVHAWDVEDIVAELRARGVRYDAARAMLPQRLAHAVLVTMEESGESPDDRVQDAVARSRPVKQYAAALWPAVDPARVVFRLLSDRAHLAECAEGVLTAEEQDEVSWPRPARSPRSHRWTLAEAILVDEAHDVVERTRSVGHLVADEAQDLSPMMLRAVGRRCSTGSATVLGDLAQATTAWAPSDWAESLAHLGKESAQLTELTRGFRVPGEVLELATRLLPVIAPGLVPPTSVRRARGELAVRQVADPVTAAVAALRATAGEAAGSTGVVTADADAARLSQALADAGVAHALLGRDDDEAAVSVVPAGLAKGLEFDHVLLLEPAAVVAQETDRTTGLRRLYVCLTRAVTSLVVLHTAPLPAELAAPPG